MLELFKKEVAQRNGIGKIRITKSGCLGPCSSGVNVVVYPEGVWYAHVTKEDVLEIVESHLFNDKPVERLTLNFTKGD